MVLPIYNEVFILQHVFDKYILDLKSLGREFEIIAVNDGCDDGSEKILADYAVHNSNVCVVNLDGRWGKQAAITAGMDMVDYKSEIILIADIDVLNPVGIFEKLVERIDGGEKIIYATREKYGWSKFKAGLNDLWTRGGAVLFGIPGVYNGKVNVSAFHRDVADVIIGLPQSNKYLRSMDTWTGWKPGYLLYDSGHCRASEKSIVAKIKNDHANMPITKSNKNARRDRVREHSASIDYMWGIMAAALIMFGLGLALALYIETDVWVELLVWCVFLGLVALGVVAYTRAVLVKRIGIIHKNHDAVIYEIKSIINKRG